MPKEPNKALRIVIPLIAIAGAIGLAIGVGMSSKGRAPAPTRPNTTTTTASPTPGSEPGIAPDQVAATPERASDVGAPGATEPTPTSAPQQATPAAQASEFAARVWMGEVPKVVLGSIDPNSGFELEVELTPFGAGVARVTTTNHYVTARDLVDAKRNPGGAHEHYVVQQIAEQPGLAADGSPITYRMAAMGVTAAIVNGKRVELFGGSYGRVWELESTTPKTATWRSEIVEAASGEAVATLRRAFTLEPGTFELKVEQSIENHTAGTLGVVWEQFGALDLPQDVSGYRIPMQRERFGYLRASQPSVIHADTALELRDDMLKRLQSSMKKAQPPAAEWPSARYDDAGPLIWAAQTNRYFMAAVYPHGMSTTPNELPVGASVTTAVLWGDKLDTFKDDRVAHRMSSRIMQLAPGARQSLDLVFYAAPVDERRLQSGVEPMAKAVRLDKIVVYNMGGFCAWCTFPWLADILMAILRFFDAITGDWAISIILLVVCVRAMLHPIFKKSQIGIQRFGKQMQRIAPKQKKLQEKYKGDPKRLHEEVRKLMREENVSYAGLFGCLPMFLQSPIWIALYAMLYTSFDLRHEAAFYGVFQQFGGWSFLGDLAKGDSFIPLPKSLHFDIPLMGIVTAINILPLLLGVVFFVHQKYLTPPSTGNMTPEQEQTQKIMKVMMVVMFPVFMYNAPAALTLYFVTNSTLGIVEGRWIRAHMDALDLDGTGGADGRKVVTNTAGGKPTLEERLRARLEAKRPPKKP